jgi:hypothetical protein
MKKRLPLAALALGAVVAPVSAVPPRTTAIKLKNETDQPLYLFKTDLKHGDWTPKLHPPEVIKPGEEGYWKSESNELGTNGTEGNVRYRLGGALWQPPARVAADRSARGGSAVASCSHNPDQIDTFWVTPNGGIDSAWWNVKTKKWSATITLTPANVARPDSPLAALSRTKDQMDLFWIAPDGAVHSMAWSMPANKWTAPFAITPANAARAGSALAAAALDAGHLDVFWVGRDGAVESASWPKSPKDFTWAKPVAVTPANATRADSSLAATPRAGGEVHLYFVGADGGVASTFWTTHVPKWVPSFRVSGPNTVGAGSHLTCLARTADHAEVLWVNPAGAVSHTWADRKVDGGKWHDPFALTGPKGARPDTSLTAVSRIADQIDAFWLAPNGAVTTAWWSAKANKGAWNPAAVLSPPATSRADASLSAVSRGGQHLDVIWIGNVGGLEEVRWDGDNVPEVYVSWDNPFISSQYGNTYHQSCPDHYELSFTGGPGNHAAANFVLAKTKVHAVPGFKPSTNGFHFSNSGWKDKNIKLPVVEISLPKPIGKIDISNSTQGLCGGMVYAAMDYFYAKKSIPQTTDPPAKESDPLFQYLKKRLETSWDPTGAGVNYVKFMQPEYPDGDEGVPQGLGVEKGRSFVIAREEWPKIKADIDAHKLSPLGLVQVKSLNPIDIGKNHQVLAYAYELNNNLVTLSIYDPNVQLNDTVRLQFNVGDWSGRIDVHRFVDGKAEPKAINTIFRTNYEPPAASLKRP